MQNSPMLETAYIEGQQYTILNASPPTYRQCSAHPIILDQGWAARVGDSVNLARLLMEKGRQVIGIDAPYGIPSKNLRTDIPDTIEEKKARAIRALMDMTRTPVADVIAHSQGALTTTKAAEETPHRFNQLVLANPAGFDNATTMKLMMRFVRDLLIQSTKQVLQKPVRYSGFSSKGTLTALGKPVEAWRNVQTIAATNIIERVRRMRLMIPGIIHTAGDSAFPVAEIEQGAKEAGIPLHVADGTHSSLFLDPEEFVEVIINMMDEHAARTATP